MRTRTLLLLAIGCGLAILLAGGIQLWRLANQATPAAPLAVGQSGIAGDASVQVVSYAVHGATGVVTVTIGGVADAAGLQGFTLVTPGKALALLPGAGTCDGITVAPVTCTLGFSLDGVTGIDRQLVFQRADERVRWKLV
jgi:hypothetical protein